MTIFYGGRDLDGPTNGIPHPERLALSLHPTRRRRARRVLPTLARWAATIATAAAIAWALSDIAVAVLLDEGSLAALGITP